MASSTHEQSINVALGEVLNSLGRRWRVRAEESGVFDGGGRADVIVEPVSGWPIVIEAEVGNAAQAEIEARSRLGRQLSGGSRSVETTIALVYPAELRKVSGAKLRQTLQGACLDYVLLMRGTDGEVTRLPETGWISGNVTDLALLLHRSAIPVWRVETLADVLERGILQSSQALTSQHPIGGETGKQIADLLGQADDPHAQTRRMAMTVVVNALVFQEALCEAELRVQDDRGERIVRPVRDFRSAAGAFRPTGLIDEWQRILGVNYWPIFHTASEVLRVLPTASAVAILRVLWATAEDLVAGGVTRSHDLTGVVFQKLIADRKFLATFYTRPAAASLLASLALPLRGPLNSVAWGNAERVGAVRIGDFACGTGTLLSTAYQRLGLLHELHQGDPAALHPQMMKKGLVGLDVLNVGVHLTAAMLAASYPQTPFDGECLLTMPYGVREWGACVGSLDLLDAQIPMRVMSVAARTAGASGSQEVHDLAERVGHGHFDLVIMNPPFTRHGAREGERIDVHNPAFAAFDASEEDQTELSRHLGRLAHDGTYHGHAGLASAFVDLGHRKLAPDGTLALVLPLSAMSGGSWEDARALLRRQYSSILVVTIAQRGNHTRSFSADTGIAECLVIGRRSAQVGEQRAMFAILNDQPSTSLHGELLGSAINDAIGKGGIRRLEHGPYGPTRIRLGNDAVCALIDCSLPEEGVWQVTGIDDLTLAQTAYQLENGRLWIEGMSENRAPSIAITQIGNFCARIGPHHLDLAGETIKSDGLPQGPFENIPGDLPASAYPCLWNHNSQAERQLVVSADHHCQIRQVRGVVPQRLRERADSRWATASRAHYSLDLRFNSQSLTVAITDRDSLGGRAWPTVIFGNRRFDFAFCLWCNSTLGLLCHWWMSNKSQAGRGTTTVTGIPLISSLDLRTLSKAQLDAAERAFKQLRSERFLPFDQMDEDPAREKLDRAVLVDILGLDAGLCKPTGPMDLLRRKLAIEPQVRADKQSRVVFNADGTEESVRR